MKSKLFKMKKLLLFPVLLVAFACSKEDESSEEEEEEDEVDEEEIKEPEKKIEKEPEEEPENDPKLTKRDSSSDEDLEELTEIPDEPEKIEQNDTCIQLLDEDKEKLKKKNYKKCSLSKSIKMY